MLGGDGTINEAANGLAQSDVPLGVLPGGTANVLAMEIGLGSRLERAAERLAQCAPRRIALGRISVTGDSRYFVCMTGAGLDAKIVHDLSPFLKKHTGKLAYWIAGFSQFPRRLDQEQIRANGHDYRCGFLLASRVRNYGGDLEIASGASLNRGDFEIVLFEGSNSLRYAWYMLGVGLRRVQKMRGVTTLAAPCVEILSHGHLQVDGEYTGRGPAHLEIAPDALTLLVPPAYG